MTNDNAAGGPDVCNLYSLTKSQAALPSIHVTSA